jgi:hypothetical protein
MGFPTDRGTWTFPGTFLTDRDKVRGLVGDTNPRSPLISDESIAFALTEEDTIHLAAALTAEMIAAQFATEVSETIDGVNRNRSSKYDQYMKLAAKLRERKGLNNIPFFGGVSKSTDQAIQDNDDIPDRIFVREQFDDPRAKGRWIDDEEA